MPDGTQSWLLKLRDSRLTDDVLLEEFYEKIDRSIQQAKEGNVLKVSTNDDLKKLLGL